MATLFQRATAAAQRKPAAWLDAMLALPERRSARGPWIAVVAALTIAIGGMDYFTGYDVSVTAFYLVPVAIAVVTLGWVAGVAAALGSMAASFLADLAAGEPFQNPLMPWWNALIAFATYLVVIWLLATLIARNARLRAMHGELEERVRQRTGALTQEIAERERLEKAVLEIGRRERASIGQDLHDGLGQFLTGTAIATQMLADKLQARHAEEETDARKVVAFIEQAIEQSRSLAKGLLLVEIESGGLIAALTGLADSTQRQFNVACAFHCRSDIHFSDDDVPTQLYHIAQEAVRNAARHGHPDRIDVSLAVADGRLTLSVQDDGTGFSPSEPLPAGLGLRIMAHRAQIIAADFAIETPAGGGTLVRCLRPHPPPPA